MKDIEMVRTNLESRQIASQPSMLGEDEGKHDEIDNEVVEDGERSPSTNNHRLCSALQLENTNDCAESKSKSYENLQSKMDRNGNQHDQQTVLLKPDYCDVDAGYNVYREEQRVNKCIVADAGNINIQLDGQSCPTSGLATLYSSACSETTENKTHDNVKVNNSGTDLVVKDDLQFTNGNGLVEEDKMVISSSADDQQLITLDNAYQSVVSVSKHSSASNPALESSTFPYPVSYAKQENSSESASDVTPIECQPVTEISGDGIEHHIGASPLGDSGVGVTTNDCAIHSMEPETQLNERNVMMNSTVASDVHVQASKVFNLNFGDSEANAESSMVIDSINGTNEEEREAQTSSLVLDQVSLESKKLDVEDNLLQETAIFADSTITSDVHVQAPKDGLLADNFSLNFGNSEANAESFMVVDSVNGHNKEHSEAQTSGVVLDQVPLDSEKLDVEDNSLQERAIFPDFMAASLEQSDNHLNDFEASDTSHPGLKDVDLVMNKDSELKSIDIPLPATYISGDIECHIDGQCEDNGKLSNQASLELNAPYPKNEGQLPLEADVCVSNPMVASYDTTKFEECDEVLSGTSQLEVEVNVESETSPKEDRIAEDSNNPNGEIQLEADEKDHTEDMDLTISPEEQVNITKQGGQVIKPPPHVVPFSDEWLAAIEAAGEEILTMKGGAVQNSPPDKSLPDPGPWSPVKRKKNQGIGPFDCTKYTNNNPPTS